MTNAIVTKYKKMSSKNDFVLLKCLYKYTVTLSFQKILVLLVNVDNVIAVNNI